MNTKDLTNSVINQKSDHKLERGTTSHEVNSYLNSSDQIHSAIETKTSDNLGTYGSKSINKENKNFNKEDANKDIVHSSRDKENINKDNKTDKKEFNENKFKENINKEIELISLAEDSNLSKNSNTNNSSKNAQIAEVPKIKTLLLSENDVKDFSKLNTGYSNQQIKNKKDNTDLQPDSCSIQKHNTEMHSSYKNVNNIVQNNENQIDNINELLNKSSEYNSPNNEFDINKSKEKYRYENPKSAFDTKQNVGFDEKTFKNNGDFNKTSDLSDKNNADFNKTNDLSDKSKMTGPFKDDFYNDLKNLGNRTYDIFANGIAEMAEFMKNTTIEKSKPDNESDLNHGNESALHHDSVIDSNKNTNKPTEKSTKDQNNSYYTEYVSEYYENKTGSSKNKTESPIKYTFNYYEDNNSPGEYTFIYQDGKNKPIKYSSNKDNLNQKNNLKLQNTMNNYNQHNNYSANNSEHKTENYNQDYLNRKTENYNEDYRGYKNSDSSHQNEQDHIAARKQVEAIIKNIKSLDMKCLGKDGLSKIFDAFKSISNNNHDSHNNPQFDQEEKKTRTILEDIKNLDVKSLGEDVYENITGTLKSVGSKVKSWIPGTSTHMSESQENKYSSDNRGDEGYKNYYHDNSVIDEDRSSHHNERNRNYSDRQNHQYRDYKQEDRDYKQDRDDDYQKSSCTNDLNYGRYQNDKQNIRKEYPQNQDYYYSGAQDYRNVRHDKSYADDRRYADDNSFKNESSFKDVNDYNLSKERRGYADDRRYADDIYHNSNMNYKSQGHHYCNQGVNQNDTKHNKPHRDNDYAQVERRSIDRYGGYNDFYKSSNNGYKNEYQGRDNDYVRSSNTSKHGHSKRL